MNALKRMLVFLLPVVAMSSNVMSAASVIQFSSDSYEVSEAAGQIGITVSIYPPPSTRTGFLMKAIAVFS